MRIILGFDPGIQRLGYGVLTHSGDKFSLSDHGLITTQSSRRIEHRLAEIDENLQELLELHQPSLIAYEEPFFKKDNTNAAKVQFVVGLILAAAGRQDIPVVAVAIASVKLQIGGSGKASKEEVRSKHPHT